MSEETLQIVLDQKLTKGDVMQVAELAGIMGAKQTSQHRSVTRLALIMCL